MTGGPPLGRALRQPVYVDDGRSTFGSGSVSQCILIKGGPPLGRALGQPVYLDKGRPTFGSGSLSAGVS